MSSQIVKTGGGELAPNLVAREEFGAKQLMLQAERAAVAMAAQAKAEVEARYSMAMHNRRDLDEVRVQLLNDCRRFNFAKAARYKIPNRGEGWTIRFAEAAVRRLGNVYIPSFIIYEDDERRIVRVTATDLESNVTWPKDTTISKTVERKNPDGREVVRQRQTSYGEMIYIVRATDEEMTVKENSLVSKTARTNALRLVPPDILDECLDLVLKTMAAQIKTDPDAARKEIADAFAALKISPKELKEYMGGELSSIAPAELQGLRELYTALREGHTTWREVMADKRGQAATDEPAQQPATGNNALKAKLHKSGDANPGPVASNAPQDAAEPAKAAPPSLLHAQSLDDLDSGFYPPHSKVKIGTKTYTNGEERTGWALV